MCWGSCINTLDPHVFTGQIHECWGSNTCVGGHVFMCWGHVLMCWGSTFVCWGS